LRIALIGATGFVGSAVLREALSRGHRVTALVRDVGKLTNDVNLKARKTDIYDEADVVNGVAQHDAAISAFNPGWEESDIFDLQVRGMRSIIAGVKQAGIKRLLVVGGAGSLEVSPGVQLVDTPDFPQQFKQGALATREELNMLQKEPELEWTFLSPSANLHPGKRTGRFRIGSDQLLTNAEGKSEISLEDFSVAMIDELEKPAHVRKRFTVGY
jgi:uncharacterized protein